MAQPVDLEAWERVSGRIASGGLAWDLVLGLGLLAWHVVLG